MAPLAPRIAVRAAEHDLPAGLVAALDTHLRAHAAGDRLLEVLEELTQIRGEAGSPPLAAPIGQILASQALIHVLSARRYGTVVDEFRALVAGPLRQRRPARSTPPWRAPSRCSRTACRSTRTRRAAEDVRAEAEGLAASEEELVLIALFGEEAEALLRTIRARAHPRRLARRGGVDQTRAERIRELVRIVQESGVAEVEIEDDGMRVSVRRRRRGGAAAARSRRSPTRSPASCRSRPAAPARRAGSSRRWSASSTARPSRARRRSSRSATPSRRARRSASSRR